MKLHTIRNHVELRSRRAGSVLVEFAFIALAFYLLFAGTLELGRCITVSQAIQNAARVGARELALFPRRPTAQFDEPFDPSNSHYNDLDCQAIRARIYDPRLLAVDLAGGEPNTDTWPVVNRMLLPVMVRSRVGGGTFLHYPGAILQLPGGGHTVGVPRVLSRAANGTETIQWLPVLEEVRANPGDPNSGPFSLASTGPERGMVALRIHCPYQATSLVAFRVQTGTTSGGVVNEVIEAHDESVSAVNSAPGGGTLVPIAPNFSGDTSEAPGHVADGSYNSGAYGLGNLYAMNADGTGAQAVRPFRRLISSQSIFRREVFAQ
ncbi:MAG: TadE family protein [Planctomycetota bacterium]|nr:TadE family protein [Planctomycetota bacterium]